MTPPDGDGRLGGLTARLRALGAEPSARELAEALWLARHVGPARTDTGAPGPAEPADPSGGPPPGPVAPGRTTGDDDGDGADPVPAPGGHPGRVLLHPDRAAPAGRTVKAAGPGPLRVRVPVATALPDPLTLQRALRPLQQYRPPVRTPALHLDEQATAEQAAETRLLQPVLHATARRESRLRLLMDASTSTGVWDTALEELGRLCAGLGAFREVTVHYLREGDDGTLLAATGRRGDRGLRAAEQLRDPTGRQLTLVLSDCAGPLWRSGRLQRLLHHWGRAAPVAVVQPLPQRMWQRTHLPVLPGTLRRREGLGARLEFTPAEGEPPPGALPVPVLSPTRGALGSWARLLAGGTGLALPGPAAWVRADHPPAPARRQRPAADPEAAVRAFRRTASRAAVHLAVAFSAVPLTLPVMQLVQRAMQPRSGPTVLAEVLLSGLLRRGDEEDGYEFGPGVRETLLRLLPRGDALLVLKHCGEYVDRHFGRRARNFPALALARLSGTDTGAEQGDADAVPAAFAEVSALVAGRFGAPAPRTRRRTVDLVYAGQDEPWAVWAAQVLAARGQEVSLRPVRGGAGALADVLADLVRRPGPERRVVLLVGDWHSRRRPADPLRPLPGHGDDRLVPVTVARTAPSSWVRDLGPLTALWDTTETEAVRRLLARLDIGPGEPGAGAGGAEFPGPTLPARDGVPEPDPAVTVPDDRLTLVRRHLEPDRRSGVCAVTGPAGSGKTALAAAYTHRYGSAYDLVRWIPPGDAAHRRGQLARLGAEFGLPADGGGTNRLGALRDVLRDTALRWLIVLDGWDTTGDAEDVEELLPGGGHVLVTSRDGHWHERAGLGTVRLGPGADTPAPPVRRTRADPVAGAVARVDAGGTATGSGFFIAPGTLVTCGAVLHERPFADRGRPAQITVTTADGRSHPARAVARIRELTVLEVPGVGAHRCLWLTDAPDTRPVDVLVQGVPRAGNPVAPVAVPARAEGRNAESVRLVGAVLPPGHLGGPVLSRSDGAVVGVVTDTAALGGGRVCGALRIELLRNLCLLGRRNAELWHRTVRAHDLHHAARRRDEAGPPPADRAELYGLLAGLEPPAEARTVLRLQREGGGRPPAAPGHTARSWRDGAGQLYAAGAVGPVVVYAARIWAHLSDRRSTQGLAPLRAWIEQTARDGLTRAQVRDVTAALSRTGATAGGCHITVDVRPDPAGGCTWSVQAVQEGRRTHHVTSGPAPVRPDRPAPALGQQLTRALAGADTGMLRATVEYRLPDALLWDLDVERWTPGAALRTECNVFVRGRDRAPAGAASQWAQRWEAVSRGPLTGLRPPDPQTPDPSRHELRRVLSDAPANAVPLWCRHAGDVPGTAVLDEARSLGYPLILWSRAAEHRHCAEFYKRAERELRRCDSVRELLARVRGLRLRTDVFRDDRSAAWARDLAVYYDPPDGTRPADSPL
ncbi:SAV_2336 N-terminal domain-related protein [Streptomyces sp. NPDC059785]|uniref:SAV_2336 N-terminal domain-related protein n=1 Tax=Streptomyces sp. NPDC059785 TaxID=3346945 RepID=UPI00365B1C0D